MKLKKLLLIHAIITLAAAMVLIISPSLIPESVNIQITPNENLLCYFLAAAELGIAYLLFFSRTIKDKHAIIIVSKTFIVFHASFCKRIKPSPFVSQFVKEYLLVYLIFDEKEIAPVKTYSINPKEGITFQFRGHIVAETPTLNLTEKRPELLYHYYPCS